MLAKGPIRPSFAIHGHKKGISAHFKPRELGGAHKDSGKVEEFMRLFILHT